eukprot:comp24208_c0_seq1/m.44473 comp24208_c0_seq1/g.44473  ORF comp24208_c0_seq1/g.44473 comp24208_c0_seq1/m.44473 type:complete len:191 (-) comp24208_c0_seq1:1845-2417(-)
MEGQGGGGGVFDFATPTLDKDAFAGELEDITVDGADQLVDKDELNDETFADDLEEWVNPDQRPGKTLQEVELELELSKLKVQDKLEKEGGLGIFAAQQQQQGGAWAGQQNLITPGDLLGEAKNAAGGMPPVQGGTSPMQRVDPSMLFARGGGTANAPTGHVSWWPDATVHAGLWPPTASPWPRWSSNVRR